MKMLIICCTFLLQHDSVFQMHPNSPLVFKDDLTQPGFFFCSGSLCPTIYFLYISRSCLRLQIQEDCLCQIAPPPSILQPSSLSPGQRTSLTLHFKVPVSSPLPFTCIYLSFNLSTAYIDTLNFLACCIVPPPTPPGSQKGELNLLALEF